jgi:hypothetical protein
VLLAAALVFLWCRKQRGKKTLETATKQIGLETTKGKGGPQTPQSGERVKQTPHEQVTQTSPDVEGGKQDESVAFDEVFG